MKAFKPVWSVPRHADELAVFYEGYKAALRKVTSFLDKNGSIAQNMNRDERDHMESVCSLLAQHVERGHK